jgi:hypothetical protein
MRLSFLGLVLGAAALGACGSQKLGGGGVPLGHRGTGGGSGLTGIGGGSSLTGVGGGTATSGDGGSSATGTGAIGGWTSTDAGGSCAQLNDEYVSAIRIAQTCAVGVAYQCQQTISSHLPVCDSCSTAVNAITDSLGELRTLWEMAACDPPAGTRGCTDAGVCNTPTNTVCADTGDGTGKCSFVVSPPANGDAGTAGTPNCVRLAAQYAAALPAAEVCGTGAQCGNLVAASLSPCTVCGTYVSDPSVLNALRHQWLQANCQNIIAENCMDRAVCLPVAGFACVGADAGVGSCTAITSSGAPPTRLSSPIESARL